MRPTTAMVSRNRTRRMGLSDWDRARIFKAYLESGRDTSATADRFRVSTQTVRDIVKRLEGAPRAGNERDGALYARAGHRDPKEGPTFEECEQNFQRRHPESRHL